jgi:phosphotransferase system enzyme I (PtsP)
MREGLNRLIDDDDIVGAGEHRDVLEAVRMVANDRGWMRRLREAIATGLTAEAAVESVQNDARARLQRQTDPYIRDRLHDLDDLANRLLHRLTGQSFVVDRASMPDNAILVARTMGPAVLLEYERARLRGLVLEEGGPTSHVAIVARALGIPAVGEVPNITDLVETGDAIIVDGTSGDVRVRPQADVENAYAEKARLRARRQEQYQKLRDVPAVTRDGIEITLHMNAGLLVDLPHVEETGAASIGLFRTELQFMLAARFPRMREQFDLYRRVLEAVPDRPVTFRTLDIGSDKVLPYMTKLEEENPALGWRAIRIGLDRPALLRLQLRALLRAAAGRSLRIMFPMVATCAEFDAAKQIAAREMEYLKRHGYATPNALELGVMIEVPSLLFELDAICAKVDFLSVGSNDLTQYLFAADRDNKRVADRFDVLSAPALRALATIACAAHAAGKPVTLCGEMGGKPLEALALAAIGYRSLSMSPASIGPVKATLISADLAETEALLMPLLGAHDGAPSLRAHLQDYAERSGIPV